MVDGTSADPRCNSPTAPHCCALPKCARKAAAFWCAAKTLPPSETAAQATATPRWTAQAQAKYDSFQWPIRSEAELDRLLQCKYIKPTDIVGFEFSGAQRQALERAGRIALSVDLRSCEVGGMHTCMDVRTVVRKQR